jgi:hypothetical protein
MAKTSPWHSHFVNNIEQETLDIIKTIQNTVPNINLKPRPYQETIHFYNCIPQEHNMYIHSLRIFLRDFRLPQRRRKKLRFSGLLCSDSEKFLTLLKATIF